MENSSEKDGESAVEADREESVEENGGDSLKENDDFDFEDFTMFIKKSIAEDSICNEDVNLKFYLRAYEQLYNFFVLLGRAFHFVASDVKSKIKILNTYCEEEEEKDENSRNFTTVKSMVAYEKDTGALDDSKYVSGSRTLLRLHRGLDFVRKFLSEIYNAKIDSKLSGIARQSYDETLAEYHTWLIKKAARVAMQFLPTRSELLTKISKNDEDRLKKIMTIFPSSLEAMNSAYDRIQNIYANNDLLNLP